MTELTIEESFTNYLTLWLLEKPLGQTLWEVDLGRTLHQIGLKNTKKTIQKYNIPHDLENLSAPDI